MQAQQELLVNNQSASNKQGQNLERKLNIMELIIHSLYVMQMWVWKPMQHANRAGAMSPFRDIEFIQKLLFHLKFKVKVQNSLSLI